MSSDATLEVSALAINVTFPQALCWTDTRRDETFILTTLKRPASSGRALAAKGYGRPVAGGRGTSVAFRVPDRPELMALIADAATRAGCCGARTGIWAEDAHRTRKPPIGWAATAATRTMAARCSRSG